MTPTEPGRSLDAMVAEKVMGLVEGRDFGEWPAHDPQDGGEISSFTCKRCFDSSGWINESEIPRYWPGPCVVEPPPYSTFIAAAWQVVDKLAASGKMACLTIDLLGGEGEEWRVFFQWDVSDDELAMPYADAPTVPLAICLAALRAVGHE